jgi:hypothetical protein
MKPFITGSSAYGPFDNDLSDIDLVMTQEQADKVRDILEAAGRFVQDADERYQAPGFYFDFFGRDINVVIATDSDQYEAWLEATRDLQNLYPIQNRQSRIENFRFMRKAVIKRLKAVKQPSAKANKWYRRAWRWLETPWGE